MMDISEVMAVNERVEGEGPPRPPEQGSTVRMLSGGSFYEQKLPNPMGPDGPVTGQTPPADLAQVVID
jgi:hypothetical protein